MVNQKLFSILFLIIFLNLNIFILSAEDVDYGEDGIKKIKDFRSSIFNSESDGFHYVGSLLSRNSTIIGFSDINTDKMTDIITYDMEEKNDQKVFSFFVHYYEKEGDDGNGRFKSGETLFYIEIDKELDPKFRNLIPGSFIEKDNKACFIVSFDTNRETGKLNHYYICKGDKDPKELAIHSNILLFNSKSQLYPQILYYDYNENTRKVCENLCEKTYSFAELFDKDCSSKFNNQDISLKGGLAFTDINGNCMSDIILTHEEENNRVIEIYRSRTVDNHIKFCLKEDIDAITINDGASYGAFALTNINDDRSQEIAPMLDLVIPIPQNNSILILYNQEKVEYEWADNYCEKHRNHDSKKALFVYDKDSDHDKIKKIESLTFGDDEKSIKTDATFPTIIRLGDFLSVSNPAILVKQTVTEKDQDKDYICLYKRENGKYELGVKFDLTKVKDNSPLYGLFFDIDETGSLSVIIPSKNGKNHFFINSRKNVFFLKSKLMKSKTNYYDTDLGTTYRYIVTDKSGDRHMDVSHQLIQTSDMNIPLPYSLMGLDQINNYVEEFITISSCNLENEPVVDANINDRLDSPIIPNTQMMIYKFINKDKKIEWNIDLIVQPMEKIWLFLGLVILVLLIVLAIIIYLHVKEVKEEQKEATKFKSWFA